MAGLSNQTYSFDEDGILRLQKDLNYMFYHLDEKNVRRLYTEYCEIKSEEGETEIDGPLLVMKGDPGTTNSTTIRLKMGWDEASSEFVFNLFGVDGTPTIELNSTGDAVFRGDINTEEDIYVGNRIFLGWDGSTVVPTATLSTRGMYVMEPGTTKYLAAIYSTYVGSTYSPYEFEIESSGSFNITARNRLRTYMYADYTVDQQTSSINSTDYYEMLSWNDRMSINQLHTGSGNIKGTYLGGGLNSPCDREVYVANNFPYWGNRVISQNETDFALRYDLRYFYSHNVKFIASPTTNWTPLTADTLLIGTTRVITSTRGCFIRAETSSPAPTFFGADSTISSLDLTQFLDGTAMTTDDYLVALVWFVDTTGYTDFWQLRLGSESTNSYYYNFTSGFTPGWNVHTKKLGAYNGSTGTPAFNNISWVRANVIATTASRPAAEMGVYLDYLGVIRANSTGYSAFQRNINSTHQNIYEPTNQQDIIYKYGIEPCIQQIPVESANALDTRIKPGYSFNAVLTAFSHRENESPSLAFYGSSFYIITRVSSGVLRLYGAVNGTTFGDYINCPAYEPFRKVEIGLRRRTGGFTDFSTSENCPDDRYTAWFRVTTDPDTYREISDFSGVSTNLSTGALYIGSGRIDTGMKITELSISPLNTEDA